MLEPGIQPREGTAGSGEGQGKTYGREAKRGEPDPSEGCSGQRCGRAGSHRWVSLKETPEHAAGSEPRTLLRH